METAGNSVSEQTHDAQEAYTRLISHIRSSSISDEAKKQIILEYLRSNLSEKINLSKLKRDTGFSYDKLCRWFRNIKSSVHNQTSFSSSAWGAMLRTDNIHPQIAPPERNSVILDQARRPAPSTGPCHGTGSMRENFILDGDSRQDQTWHTTVPYIAQQHIGSFATAGTFADAVLVQVT